MELGSFMDIPMIETQIAVSLYEQDYLLWIEDVVHKLQTRDIQGLDFDNLIEEIESLGRSVDTPLAKAEGILGSQTRR